jgi:hypothetical protein
MVTAHGFMGAPSGRVYVICNFMRAAAHGGPTKWGAPSLGRSAF